MKCLRIYNTLLELLKKSIVKIRKIASIVHSIQYKQIKN
ncbi:hypothetical protein LEP1GSC127_3088 [Leptospira kirschneri str. 200801925]|uniref:Uncharacterized protein n=1 Tax=Leptospira kirschneri str. 200802841 TaxID=1193047 RepID=A0A828XW41_9LEPT|nr:hypothetical protein LEP1GSC044_3022 [Leptospira kirschneri serovar Grippotyphosa str. RM52]EKO51409.1 hypothetical protein LEP1GSC131_1922 [Leptospira kirschneri str. 200802841]EKQ82729.1 hypothetical protein LEP1GSC064_1845 [Leptospira kirschneri serovar Grippotyphosa str. Moskva]EMK19198.1 hypothetical protein LEP1GSC042_3671 [Leptospira kirschneri serovar Bim str. PUO 1247]EMN26049.1 hypothetical protein LEP1GSC065_1122 [Leptospira kirschneri serovar Sokoine str. RM1]EMO76844.1 hypothet